MAIDQVRRALRDAMNRSGMTAGMPKCTVMASDIQHLLAYHDAHRARVTELREGINDFREGKYLNPKNSRGGACKHGIYSQYSCDLCDDEYWDKVLGEEG